MSLKSTRQKLLASVSGTLLHWGFCCYFLIQISTSQFDFFSLWQINSCVHSRLCPLHSWRAVRGEVLTELITSGSVQGSEWGISIHPPTHPSISPVCASCCRPGSVRYHQSSEERSVGTNGHTNQQLSVMTEQEDT